MGSPAPPTCWCGRRTPSAVGVLEMSCHPAFDYGRAVHGETSRIHDPARNLVAAPDEEFGDVDAVLGPPA